MAKYFLGKLMGHVFAVVNVIVGIFAAIGIFMFFQMLLKT